MSYYADLARPSKGKSFSLTYDFAVIIAGSLFLALMAQISLPLWFTPIRLSLQSFAVLMIGSLLGSKRGALAVLTYLAEGACGFPVFAGGFGGIAYLAGPSGGYLIGFVLATYLIGWLLEKGWKKDYSLTLTALCIGTVLILSLGSLWLSYFVGFEKALIMGTYPFLIGESLKVMAAGILISSGWKFFK